MEDIVGGVWNNSARGEPYLLGNLGFSELLIIFVIALVIFGPSKLPELGKGLGRGIKEFKKATQSLEEEVSQAVKDMDKATEPKNNSPTPVQNAIPTAAAPAPASAPAKEESKPQS